MGIEEKIGFWGISQAGWVSPLAASMSSDISFMIIISGGGATPRESEHYSYCTYFERIDLSKQDREEGMLLVNAYFNYLSTGNEYEKTVKIFSNHPEN